MKVLVAGIGNIFMGDDGFGVEVAQRLARRPKAEQVTVVDFGIRGMELTYALLDDGYDAAILVDVSRQGGQAGTLYVLKPRASEPEAACLDGHSMEPSRVLAAVRAMGGSFETLRVVACEPASFGTDEEPQMSLSAPVAAAVEPAVRMVESLVFELLGAEAMHA